MQALMLRNWPLFGRRVESAVRSFDARIDADRIAMERQCVNMLPLADSGLHDLLLA